MVLPHECLGHLVVRTLATHTVTGNVIRQWRTSNRPSGRKTDVLKPGATLPRGRSVCMETRLVPILPEPVYEVDAGVWWPEGTVTNTRPAKNAPTILPDPYEVATAYRDPLTGRYGEWRLVVQMQRRPTGTWLVTVGRFEEAPFMAVAMKDLLVERGPLGRTTCEFPLSRFIKETAQKGTDEPETVWDRLVEDDQD